MCPSKTKLLIKDKVQYFKTQLGNKIEEENNMGSISTSNSTVFSKDRLSPDALTDNKNLHSLPFLAKNRNGIFLPQMFNQIGPYKTKIFKTRLKNDNSNFPKVNQIISNKFNFNVKKNEYSEVERKPQ